MRKEKGFSIIAVSVIIIILFVLVGVGLNILLRKNKIADNNEKSTSIGFKGIFSKKVDLSKYQIGDYVAYTYDEVPEGYTLPSTQSGDFFDQTIHQNINTLKWRILNLDESTGKIDLIGEPTDNEVHFRGALGYNNGAYLLNDICEKLYSNNSKKIKARSINLEDMEKHLTDAGFKSRSDYKSGTNTLYGKTYTYTSNKQYPNLYASELGAGINASSVAEITTEKVVDPYKESTKGSLTATPANDTAKVGDLTVTQTYYYIPIDKTNYGDAAEVLKASNYYWVASRFVYANNSSYTRFGLRAAYTYMNGNCIFYSDGGSYNGSLCLRPVVSLDSRTLGEKDANGVWQLK